MENEKFIIIDGNSLMHRAFYAIPNLTNSKGFHTSVIYGFVNMLNKLKEELKPQYIGIAFDRKAPTFRHLEYKEYKAGRKKMPQEMAEQIPVLKEILTAMNIKQLEIDGYEADDIIGTLAKRADEQGLATLIVTGDRDAFQLITDNVHVLITKKGISDMEHYDAQLLMENYLVTPAQIVDLKGLMGDASDNIPGVPGIGEKTAQELIKHYSSVEGVLENVDGIKKNKVKENLITYREQAILSKRLATIITQVPIQFELQEFAVQKADNAKLHQFYMEMEFKSFLDKLDKQSPDLIQPQFFNEEACILLEAAQLKDFALEAQKSGELVIKIDTKASGLVKQIYLCLNGKAYSLIINDNTFADLKVLLEDTAISKIGHDIKEDVTFLKNLDIHAAPIGFDTMLAAYLLNPSRSTYTLSDLCLENLGMNVSDYETKNGDAALNFCNSVKAIAALKEILKEKLSAYALEKLYFEMELPLLSILADMEHIGFKVDKNMLEALSIEFGNQISGLTDSIYMLAGEQFNINSTKQLGTILFEKLGLPAYKKTKTGYSTDVEVLEDLSDKHPIIESILEYRQLLKIKSTYIDGLMHLIQPSTGKVHSKLNQTVAATGRLSSTDPNLQNIPIKTENGRQIRKVFVPSDEDHLLVDADYSQIELRILAHISGDPGLIKSFIENEDIHTRTASEVFGVPINEVTPLMRKRAKAVNFGIVYGISDFGLARDLKITKKEAKTYIENYFERYPLVKKYMVDIVEQAKSKGYVTTIFDRRRFIPELTSANAITRNFGERIAMNTPIQGSAADIIKIAMIKVYNALKDQNLKSKLILQVHDELIVETHKSELQQVMQIVKENMESAASLSVPLTVDVKEGRSWFESK